MVNQLFSQHMIRKINSNMQRVTELDVGKCPREQCQWCVMALRLSSTTPYLLLWAFITTMEGAPLSSQRDLLTALGFVFPFRWKLPHSNMIYKPVSENRRSSTFYSFGTD